MNDPVNHPAHYTRGGYETIDFIEQYFDDSYIGGQVVKYVSRAGYKDRALYKQDLEKARWYARRMMERHVARWHMQDIGRNVESWDADLLAFADSKLLGEAEKAVLDNTFRGYWDKVVEGLDRLVAKHEGTH